ncbi:MAG: polyprenyl synthetase family protein [Thermoprotei archaeon]
MPGIEDVEREIKIVLRGEPEILFDAANYLISTGGKRLRPRLLLTFNDALGGNHEQAIKAAASIEMLHNFTLIHDDIMDKDETRHGVPTTHVKYGEAIAILAGDVLQSQSQMEMARATEGLPKNKARHLLERHAHISTEIARGQTLDMTFEDLPYEKFNSKLYYSMIRLKTAVLFSHACWVGAYLADASSSLANKAATFGLNLGMAFQMADDILGLVGDPSITGKPVGSDVRNGKKTMPIIIALSKLSGEKRLKVLNMLKEEDISVIDDIVEIGGIDDTKLLMNQFYQKAESVLSAFPKSTQIEDLRALLSSSVVREK